MITLSDNDFIISDVKVEHLTPSFYTEGLNFVGNGMGRGLHRLNIECSVHFADENDIRKFQALMLRVQGRTTPFNLSLQDTTDGKGFFNPLSLDMSGSLGSQLKIGNKHMTVIGLIGSLPVGTMFQFQNDSKIYTVTTVTGNKVEFYPAVRTAHSLREPLNFKPVPRVRLTEDKFSIKYERGSSVTIKMMEAL
ncbi:hypothetical protein [Enterovibrio calviensis]|uniref:hypothetical protein n=1 Tax=Enterovibrio calviensis TaxID=91359 RepID=UPI0004856D20|nr:hypothetical protein [Enterovibrio calviensis]